MRQFFIFLACACFGVSADCFGQAFWTNRSIPNAGTVYSLIADPGGTLFAASDAGIYRSTNRGDSWMAASTGLPADIFGNRYVYQLVIETNGAMLAASWAGVYVSRNGGQNWTSSNNGFYTVNPSIRCMSADSSGNLVAAVSGDLFKSTDLGSTWYHVLHDPFGAFATVAVSPWGSLFAANFSGYNYRSIDRGEHWNRIPYDSLPRSVSCFLFTNDGRVLAGTQYNGVSVSSDSGKSWKGFTNSGLPDSPSISSLWYWRDGYYYVVIYLKGVYRLSSTGVTWLAENSGLTNYNVRCLGSDPQGYFYVGGDNGGVFRTVNAVTEVVHTIGVPRSFRLSQNYPNPFNPSTTIEFALPHSGLATLKIFNLLGEEVTTLVNEMLPAGTYRIGWNANSSPSGVYFYQLQAGDFTETKKLILLK